MIELNCPHCGEQENLRGRRAGNDLTIICATCDVRRATCDVRRAACGASWTRDRTPRCATCGGQNLVHRPVALMQKARGNAISMVGAGSTQLCAVCDADASTAIRRPSTAAPYPPNTSRRRSAAGQTPRIPLTATNRRRRWHSP